VAHSQAVEPTRRDFLYIATGTFGAFGAALAAWPFVDQMNPTGAVLALASIEVDLSSIQPGQSVTFTYRSHPLFVRRRTPKEIEDSRAVKIADLIDPLARNANFPEDAQATDDNRLTPNVNAAGSTQAAAQLAVATTPAQEGAASSGKPVAETAATAGANMHEKPEWLVVIGVCTHLGCTPTAFQGNYGGWLCHCHGSQYDTAGRVRQGPAPQNLAVPAYTFLTDTRIKVG